MPFTPDRFERRHRRTRDSDLAQHGASPAPWQWRAELADAALSALFVAIVLAMLAYGVAWIRRALTTPTVTAHEAAVPSPA